MKRTDVLMALVACLALGACAPKARDNSANIRMDGSRPATSTNGGSSSGIDTTVGTFTTKCASGESSVGLIKDDASLSAGGSTFKSRVGDLVSATLDPQQLGDIAGAGATGTGLDLYLKLKADAQGQIAAESGLQILIYDSYVGQIDATGVQIQPYPIVITKGAQGLLNRGQRSFQVSFTDAYGTVILEGTYDDSYARGSVRFSNTRAFDGGAPRSGQLGQFVIPSCNLF